MLLLPVVVLLVEELLAVVPLEALFDALFDALISAAAEVVTAAVVMAAVVIVTAVTFAAVVANEAQPLVKPIAIPAMKHNCQFQ